jgi:hypothetical protein
MSTVVSKSTHDQSKPSELSWWYASTAALFGQRAKVEMPELTTSQAVRSYEVHPNVLNRLILMGRLAARKNADGHWLISKDFLERWNRQRVRRAPKPLQQANSALAEMHP